VFAGSPALRAGLTTLLAAGPGLVVLSDDDLAIGESPDVILLDAGDTSLAELVDEQWPRTPLLLVGEPDPEVLAGADRLVGAVSNGIDAARLSAAVQAMAAGLVVLDPELDATFTGTAGATRRMPEGPDILTPRERQVLELVARGYPNKSIAYELGISEHTAKFHVGSLLTKLEAASRTEVVTNATRRGLLSV
jgi:two-component system nitrate/nitrite response regulator NarL